jgi:cyclopropane-fatty-acyl-phospholipid synthase
VPAEDIDTAQEAKLDLICRKLRLRPGETLLDVGCGWGALVQYAGERYGTRCTGITLSEPQASLARARIAAAGLSDRCRIEMCDYRDLRGITFDKVVSVGMFEHVGRVKMPTYFSKMYRLTKPGGLFLNHGIVIGPLASGGFTEWVQQHLLGQGSFIQTYVFPDGELMAPHEAIGFAEKAGFETRDVENLREHYALTLRQWVSRLEKHHDEAVRLVGEETYRIWRLYMAFSAGGFARAQIGVTQMLFSRTGRDGVCRLPRTREDLYSEPLAISR